MCGCVSHSIFFQTVVKEKVSEQLSLEFIKDDDFKKKKIIRKIFERFVDEKPDMELMVVR